MDDTNKNINLEYGRHCHWPTQIHSNPPTFSLMNMNITVNQPAQPSPAQPSHLQAVDLPPSNASKTIEKIIAFAICLHEEIDASRFSGPEQFFACAPYIFFKKSNVVFSTPNRPMPMPRSIAVLENDRKRSKKS